MAGRRSKHETAILVARRSNGTEVERHEMALEDYYQNLHEMIDSATYRATHGIAVIEGQLVDQDGRLFQEFQNRYGADGTYEGGRTTHADGTINED